MKFEDYWKKDLENNKIDNRECNELAEEFFNLGLKETRNEIIDSLKWLLDDKTCPKKDKLPKWVRFHIMEMIEDTKYNANCDNCDLEKMEKDLNISNGKK